VKPLIAALTDFDRVAELARENAPMLLLGEMKCDCGARAAVLCACCNAIGPTAPAQYMGVTAM
jgi:hypothetical protein